MAGYLVGTHPLKRTKCLKWGLTKVKAREGVCQRELSNGADGGRTHDLLHAMQTRFQLRHGPEIGLPGDEPAREG